MIPELYNKIKTSRTLTVSGMSRMSEKAFLAARLFSRHDNTMAAVFADQKQAERFMDVLLFFLPAHTENIIFFPGYNILPFKSLSYHKETTAIRIDALSRIVQNSSKKGFVVTCIQPMLQKVIPKSRLTECMELILDNEEIDREALVQFLEATGYSRSSLVEEPGEYAVRGAILDIFSPGSPHPVRLDFFGDLVESLRFFSPVTQRGIKHIAETVIIPASEAVIQKEFIPHILARLRQAGRQAGIPADKMHAFVQAVREQGRFPGMESMLPIVYDSLDAFVDYLPENTLFMVDEPARVAESAADFTAAAKLNYETAKSENRLCVPPDSMLCSFEAIRACMDQHRTVSLCQVNVAVPGSLDPACVIEYSGSDNSLLSEQLKRQGRTEKLLGPLVEWLEDKLEKKMAVLFVISQDIQARRLVSLLQPYGVEPVYCRHFSIETRLSPGVYYTSGNVTHGFVCPDQHLALVTEKDIFQLGKVTRRSGRRHDVKNRFITPEELKNNDIIVHVQHGIGRYEGLVTLTIDNMAQDFILLVYQDDDKLYLPVDRMEMIGKYVGVEGYTPVLDKIGSKSWINSKKKAKEEVEKLAAELLELYARRRANKGFSFSQPDTFFNEFEAAFPYTETRDQLKAIDHVLEDMASPRPMDRLICGDVGYGKTEVALRAAFKAVCDGQQVAVVVPTTILAEQHAATFKERLSGYPVTVECLSRFRTRKEQGHIIKHITGGQADIVIGTHRLLQKDIHFQSLGLLIIDEEQRFGVQHKERLKKKRSTVDVLALTATPIPRTLHMSLTGMRDISVISTPPEDRQAIVSYISTYDDAIVVDAIRKEIARKGQIFFVHNHIKSISGISRYLKELVPEARIEIAHGRLAENELEKVMLDFISRKIDVLLCTTIIESGLDIPAANTMIINRAERFGLAQIYQLRGRIGRGDHQAYAYLFVSDEEALTKDAKKRLAALMEYRDLGSGFQIAMKDLQIRGAGSALGVSQSGHIAAVGYDMFLKLLDHAVKDMKGESVEEHLDPEINVAMSCFLGQDYIESVEQRLTIYRRLSQVSQISQISDIQKELEDRFGPLPKEAQNMLLKIMLRVCAINAGVKRLDVTTNSATISFSRDSKNQVVHHLERLSELKVDYKPVTRDTIKINLGSKRGKITRTLLDIRRILKHLAQDRQDTTKKS